MKIGPQGFDSRETVRLTALTLTLSRPTGEGTAIG